MQKMKNGKKVLCLSLAMAAGMLSTSAFASWNVYGGSNNHNAVVTEAPTTPDKSGLDSYIQLHCTGSGWDGVDNVPVLQTVNGTTYAYVLYDGYGASGALVDQVRGKWRQQHRLDYRSLRHGGNLSERQERLPTVYPLSGRQGYPRRRVGRYPLCGYHQPV